MANFLFLLTIALIGFMFAYNCLDVTDQQTNTATAIFPLLDNIEY